MNDPLILDSNYFSKKGKPFKHSLGYGEKTFYFKKAG
jgi:hypothetical protein